MKKINILPALFLLIFVACGSPNAKEEAFYVRGNCGMCKERLETGVKKMDGVYRAVYNVDKETIQVSYDSTKLSRVDIEKKCADLGHGTNAVPMNEESHKDLPECCKVSHNNSKH